VKPDPLRHAVWKAQDFATIRRMVAFIQNPRRASRILIRCDARLALHSGRFFVACTVDVGPGGCGVAAAPVQLTRGERTFFEIEHEGERYFFTGTVAWSSTTAPWRAGVAFDASSLECAAALFGRIASAHAEAARGVDRIPEDAILAPTPVPGTLTALPRESEVLLAIGAGIEARALRDRLGEQWDSSVNAVFALVERGEVEVRDVSSSAPALTS
jgi:hypothetical protein